MELKIAIERQRQALIAIVAMLYAMIGLAEGSMIERIKRPMRKAALALLRPAEWAVRRLIVAAAQGLKVKARAKRPAPAGRFAGLRKGQDRKSFQLFDPRVRYDFGALDGRRGSSSARRPRPQGPAPMPRIRYFDFAPLSPLYRRHEPPPPPAPAGS